MTKIDPRLEKLQNLREATELGGGQSRIDRQHEKGSLTARERINLLLDEGSFREIGALISNYGHKDDEPYGDGVVCGYGTIDGRTIYVYAQDFTVQGGSLGEMHAEKICRVMDLAAKTGSPIVGMIDSGGARIQEGVYSLGGYAKVFRRNAIYSGVIPQISLIMGPCAGGASYSPAVTDLIVMVRGKSYMFLTGPAVIKTVTGEDVDSESLGGADVHLTTSGNAHLIANSDEEAIAIARTALSYLPSNNVDMAPQGSLEDDIYRRAEALNTLVPADPSTPYSMREAIEQIFDTGSFLELQKGFAGNAIVGFARLGGQSVAIVSQEPADRAGLMDVDSSDKIARMVNLADSFNIPIITFIDSPGFLPGVDQEYRGVIRHGAKVLYAYANATVPLISVVTRKAYGGAYVVLSSKFMGTDICYAWPSAEIAVMGAEGAANILYGKQIRSAEDPAAKRAELTAQYQAEFLNPYAAAKAGFIDEVIEPAETRRKLAEALHALRNKVENTPPRKHGNMPV